jgi:ribosomal protein S18 acetylase RimI-like enzyme
MGPAILPAVRGMVNQVDHPSRLAWSVMTIEIREAEPGDHPEAGRVTALAYREFVPADDDGDWARYLERMADVAERAERTHILIAVDEGRVVGCVTLELEGRVGDWDGDPPLEPGEAHIRMLGVDPAARARGVGTRLMAAAEARARDAGKTFVTLHTTPRMEAAQRMYARLGYERTEDHVFPDGFVLLGYRKELSGSIT